MDHYDFNDNNAKNGGNKINIKLDFRCGLYFVINYLRMNHHDFKDKNAEMEQIKIKESDFRFGLNFASYYTHIT
jgi:hypothetical protein